MGAASLWKSLVLKSTKMHPQTPQRLFRLHSNTDSRIGKDKQNSRTTKCYEK
jgi:hypothetical protein